MDPTELLLLQDLIRMPAHMVRLLGIEVRFPSDIPKRERRLALKGHLDLSPVAVAQVRDYVGAARNLGRRQIPDLGREFLWRLGAALFPSDRLAHARYAEHAGLGGQIRELVRVAVQSRLVLALV